MLLYEKQAKGLLSLFGLKSANQSDIIRYYPDLWTYMKAERLIDTRLVQAMLGGLDQHYTKIFHQERDRNREADDEEIERATQIE